MLLRIAEMWRNPRAAGRNRSSRREIPSAELTLAFGQLRIERLLARGGMGLVYKAFDRKNNRPVALKVLPIEGHDDPEMLDRFVSEARILSELSHPNIVKAYESGQTAGKLYLIMEFVDGPSLRQMIRQGPLPASAAVKIAVQICDALAYAHERGIVHRDIKPENILLHPGQQPAEKGLEEFFEKGGRARLVDFGLARALAETPDGLSLTAPHQYVGTADYVAPEARYGQRSADARGDIYSLGVVIYEMLTGKVPLGHFEKPSRTLGVSSRLDRIVMRCLAANPDQRYANAAELRHDLEAVDYRRAVLVASAAVVCCLVAALIWFRWPQNFSQRTISRTFTQMPSDTQEIKSAPTSDPVRTQRPATRATTIPTKPSIPSVPQGWILDESPFMPPQMLEHRPTPESLVLRYGFDRVVEVFVDGIASAQEKSIQNELRNDLNPTTTLSYVKGDELFLYMAPCRDLATLAAKIHFGAVVRVDETNRLIQVEMPPSN
jgi:serine/threonine protein kinase